MLPSLFSTAAFIIDDIIVKDDDGNVTATYNDVLGGGGVHTVFGARLWFQPENAKELGYIALVGKNCSQHTLEKLEALKISLEQVAVDGELHPRAENYFNGTSGSRGFLFTTPEKSYASHFRIRAEHVPESWFSSVKIIHLLMSPDRAIEWIEKYEKKRNDMGVLNRPLMFWEPSPTSCVSKNWNIFCEALKLVDVVSPNLEEGIELSRDQAKFEAGETPENLAILTQVLASAIQRSGSHAHLVIRAAHMGCMVVENHLSAKRREVLIPAFWPNGSEEVVDVTGAGNSFMGGLMAGYHLTNEIVEASFYGSVSASFTIQMIGTPVLTVDKHNETWNAGDYPKERLALLKKNSS
ncbi:hypothetical protein HDU97_009602 [Phlyctochytrium planicorne]|nr:hypothetical protein HDU97_009602 [Phlyctochytrium planicorne]